MSLSWVSIHFVFFQISAMVAIELFSIRNVSSLNQTNNVLNQTNAYLHHKCINSQGTYKSGSPYEESLNRVIQSISSTNLRTGFSHVSNGDASNSVFAKLQCRGDSYGSKCRSCLTSAFSAIRRRCPEKKGRIIWFDNCVLEISPINTLAKIDYQNNFYMYNAKAERGDVASFNKNTRNLLYELKEKATSNETNAGKDNVVYAAGEQKFGTKNLYAMVQCTQDLSTDECNVCLNWLLPKLPKCCNSKQGGRFLSTSCNFRYELYPFVRT